MPAFGKLFAHPATLRPNLYESVCEKRRMLQTNCCNFAFYVIILIVYNCKCLFLQKQVHLWRKKTKNPKN